MENEERRRKFHESLLNMLYPPPSSPPHITQGRDEEERVNLLRDCLNVDHISEESGSSSSSDDDEGECESQKLTRAQRKRLRKRKLKRASSHRRKIIGPLLPTNSDDGVVDLRNEAQGVRCNVAEKSDIGNDKPGEPAACTNQNKLKHRRMAKNLARERSIPSLTENRHQDCDRCSNTKRLARES
ncbi:hypothetical protein U1Q18_039094 [Sarracenia purpurea var. burkii]